jgi:hypothetical protein
MIYWLRNVVAYLICAIAAEAVARWIGSSVVADTLIPSLAATVIALLAINVQTTAVIAVKLRELAERAASTFGSTLRQFRLALYEQAVLVIAAFAVSAFGKSPLAAEYSLQMNVAALFVLFASLHIFLDTSIGLLVALFPEHSE